MNEAFRFDETRKVYVIEGLDIIQKYRLIVPQSFVDEQLGGTPDDDARYDWLRGHLPQILSAYTARQEGGWVKAPYSSILVEEID